MTTPTYITTPIYYASGSPHLGHAYSTLLADCCARYSRLRNRPTQFTTGMDEHGLKIERIATEHDQAPQAFVDDRAAEFKDAWQALGIQYDDFIRTTEDRHKAVAIEVWNRMKENGDIYLDTYAGLYCVDCEQYYQDSELDEGCCPIHQRPVEKIEEASYFFRLSKYQNQLIDYIESHPDFIVPKTRENEVLGFLKSEPLQDLSISRTSFKWGVPVPDDPAHVMYVWIDALVNYISSLGGIGTDAYSQYWDHAVHIIGKDILRFHAVYWPSMLMSAGLPLPKTLVVHGWWTIQSRKISKSDAGTRVDPQVLAQDLSSDALRFFLMSGVTLGNDGDLIFENMIHDLNINLANILGNLVNRIVAMSGKYFDDSQVPSSSVEPEELEQELKQHAIDMRDQVATAMDAYRPHAAITALMQYVSELNQYMDTRAPWQLIKEEGGADQVAMIFSTLIEALSWVSAIGSPFFPSMAQSLRSQLGISGPIAWPEQFECGRSWTITKGEVLFQRIDAETQADYIKRWTAE